MRAKRRETIPYPPVGTPALPPPTAHRYRTFAVVSVALACLLTYIGASADSRSTPQAIDPPARIAALAAPEPVKPQPRTGTIDSADWSIFKTRFVQPDGKLVDSHSQLSHSEGQGYAMLLALAADDRVTFDQVWAWTRLHLRRPDDALLAWKWQADGKGGGSIADKNDAADADILIAWALHRAAQQWREPSYDIAAVPIAADILDKLVRDIGGYAILLPGIDGFEHRNGTVVNLSYWIFPAFRSLNELVPSMRWFQLEQSGLYLLSAARFGREQLPPDWIVLSSPPQGGIKMSLLMEKPEYGFDAVRIPLYLLWDGKISSDLMAPFLAYWKSARTQSAPATVNLASGTPTNFAMSQGMQAIVAAVESRVETPPSVTGAYFIPVLPALDQDHDYYSAALGLLVRLALNETS